MSNFHFHPPYSVSINLLVTLPTQLNKLFGKLRVALWRRHTAAVVLQFTGTYTQHTRDYLNMLKPSSISADSHSLKALRTVNIKLEANRAFLFKFDI